MLLSSKMYGPNIKVAPMYCTHILSDTIKLYESVLNSHNLVLLLHCTGK